MLNKILNKPIHSLKQLRHILSQYDYIIDFCLLLGCLSLVVILFLKECSNPPVTLKTTAVKQNVKWIESPALNTGSTGCHEPTRWDDGNAYLKGGL
jgi:hypothetical protein